MADIAVIDNKVKDFPERNYYHSSCSGFASVPCEVSPPSRITTPYLLAFRECRWSTHFQALLNCCLIALALSRTLYFKALFLSF